MMTIFCLIAQDLHVLIKPFPLYVWAKSTSDALFAPVKRFSGIQEWETEMDSNKRNNIIMRCILASFIGIFPFIASAFLHGFIAFVFALRNIKVVLCGLLVYASNAIVVRPVEDWFCNNVMNHAPPGTYLMNVENHEPYSRRIIRIYSTHLLVQNLPCLFLLGLNVMSFKSLTGFGYFKLAIAIVVAFYGLYFMIAYNQTCVRCMNKKKSDNEEAQAVHVKVHTSAIMQGDTVPTLPSDGGTMTTNTTREQDEKDLKKRLSPKPSRVDLGKEPAKPRMSKEPSSIDSKPRISKETSAIEMDSIKRASTKVEDVSPTENGEVKKKKKKKVVEETAPIEEVKQESVENGEVKKKKKKKVVEDGSSPVEEEAKHDPDAIADGEVKKKKKKKASVADGEQPIDSGDGEVKKKKKKKPVDGQQQPPPTEEKLTAQFTFGSIE
jgi:hypothetical protein